MIFRRLRGIVLNTFVSFAWLDHVDSRLEVEFGLGFGFGSEFEFGTRIQVRNSPGDDSNVTISTRMLLCVDVAKGVRVRGPK